MKKKRNRNKNYYLNAVCGTWISKDTTWFVILNFISFINSNKTNFKYDFISFMTLSPCCRYLRVITEIPFYVFRFILWPKNPFRKYVRKVLLFKLSQTLLSAAVRIDLKCAYAVCRSHRIFVDAFIINVTNFSLSFQICIVLTRNVPTYTVCYMTFLIKIKAFRLRSSQRKENP